MAVAQAGTTPPPSRFERAYIETKTTADVYVTEGTISMQPQQIPIALQPGIQPPSLPAVATFEITKEEWEQLD